MRWHVLFQEKVSQAHPGAGVWVNRVSRQPGWVTKTAVALAMLVVVVPIVVLTLTAVIVGVAAFLILGTIARLGSLVTGLFGGGPRDDGRENVQVIDRP